MFTLPSPPGFEGFREDRPLRLYRRNLPHWRQTGATYFVTFRLGDSIPQPQQILLQDLKSSWERNNPGPHTAAQLNELHRIIGAQTEKWLDTGLGSCLFRDCKRRDTLLSAMRFFDLESGSGNEKYCLGALVLMPNHVHILIRPLAEDRWPLETILKSWKQYSSRRFEQGRIWAEESFDRIVRDEEHLWRCLQYIGRNPARAGLAESDYCRWVRPEWEAAGWRFVDV